MNNEKLANVLIYGKRWYSSYSEDYTNPNHIPTNEEVSMALASLSEREQFVIRKRFDEKPMTLESLGKMLPRSPIFGGGIGVNRERVRQIEAKALRKLRHPSRLKILGFKHSK